MFALRFYDGDPETWQPTPETLYPFASPIEVEVKEQWKLKDTEEWYDEDDPRWEENLPHEEDYRQVAIIKQ